MVEKKMEKILKKWIRSKYFSDNLAEKVIEMIKVAEIAQKKFQARNVIWNSDIDEVFCPDCQESLYNYNNGDVIFCPYCGQRIKW